MKASPLLHSNRSQTYTKGNNNYHYDNIQDHELLFGFIPPGMRHVRWQILLGAGLILLSAIIYLIHFYVFRDAHHIFIYLIGDIAFVPVEVLLVTMIIHKLLDYREKKAKMEKLNMVIETFFSEVGTVLLSDFTSIDPDASAMRQDLIINNKWTDKDFNRAGNSLGSFDYDINIDSVELKNLRDLLLETREFLLRLLENPVLLEHESFTDLLRSVFHLTEELSGRDDIDALPDSDLKHLRGDIKRVYKQLVSQWLSYMKYLKTFYPYLFSFALRVNPFDKEASPIVR